MKVQELIEELQKIPNKNLTVSFMRLSRNFAEKKEFTEVQYNDFECNLIQHVSDWAIVGDDELERMKDNHEIW